MKKCILTSYAVVDALALSVAQAVKKPNFVFILAEDQGCNALSTRIAPDRKE